MVVKVCHFIGHLGVWFERAKAMRKTRRDPELGPILDAERRRNELSISRLATTDIDSDIKYGAMRHAHQLALLERRCLKI